MTTKLDDIDAATLSCVDAATGRTVWSDSVKRHSESGRRAYPSVVAASGRWVVLERGDQNVLVDAANGRAVWYAKLGRILALADDALLFVPRGGANVVCWDAATRTERWRAPYSSESLIAYVSEGLVLFRDGETARRIVAHDLASGAEILSARARSRTAPVHSGGYLYLNEGSRLSAYVVKAGKR